MNIIIYAICKNEAQFAKRFLAFCAEADGVYVLDTGSTDGTPERLRALGATVYEQTITPWRFDIARNASLDMLPEDADVEFYRGAGCEECYHTGTSGRRAVFEILTVDARLRRMIAEGARYDELYAAARQTNFETLRERCRELVLRGEVSAAEAARAINSAAE